MSGTPRILSVATRTDEEWDAYLAQHPEATLFHTRRWARLVTAAFPALRDESFALETADGLSLVPLFSWRRAGGLVVSRHSSFPFLYGGPVPRCHGSVDLLPAALANLRGTARLQENPFFEAESAPLAMPGWTSREDATHLVALPPTVEAFEAVCLSGHQRNEVRRFTRRGVLVEPARSAAEVESYERLYRGSFERWGGTPGFVYPSSYFRALFEATDWTLLSLARFEGRTIGATLSLRWNGKAHYLGGYFDPEAKALHPALLLQIDAMQRAVEWGAGTYDFLPSGGHASVEEFKRRLGGERRGFRVHERRDWLRRLLDRRRAGGG